MFQAILLILIIPFLIMELMQKEPNKKTYQRMDTGTMLDRFECSSFDAIGFADWINYITETNKKNKI